MAKKKRARDENRTRSSPGEESLPSPERSFVGLWCPPEEPSKVEYEFTRLDDGGPWFHHDEGHSWLSLIVLEILRGLSVGAPPTRGDWNKPERKNLKTQPDLPQLLWIVECRYVNESVLDSEVETLLDSMSIPATDPGRETLIEAVKYEVAEWAYDRGTRASGARCERVATEHEFSLDNPIAIANPDSSSYRPFVWARLKLTAIPVLTTDLADTGELCWHLSKYTNACYNEGLALYEELSRRTLAREGARKNSNQRIVEEIGSLSDAALPSVVKALGERLEQYKGDEDFAKLLGPEARVSLVSAGRSEAYSTLDLSKSDDLQVLLAAIPDATPMQESSVRAILSAATPPNVLEMHRIVQGLAGLRTRDFKLTRLIFDRVKSLTTACDGVLTRNNLPVVQFTLGQPGSTYGSYGVKSTADAKRSNSVLFPHLGVSASADIAASKKS